MNRVLLVVAVVTSAMAFCGPRPSSHEVEQRVEEPSVAQAGDERVDHVTDEVDLLSGDEPQAEQYLQQIYRESGVDIRLLFLAAVPAGDIAAFARERMRELGVGKTVDRRGLLFVYDLSQERLRIEVGPGLEHVITDAFAGYLMREHAKAFFTDRRAFLGVRTTLFMVHRRIRDAALGGHYDGQAIAFITDPRRLAAGAGATARTPIGQGESGFLASEPTTEARARFSAQPTVEAAYLRYIEWLRDGQFQGNVTLFTPETRELWSRYPMTRAFNDYILFGMYGHSYVIHERGGHAILVFTSTPFISPAHFRRSADGWQVDIIADLRNTREHVGGRYTWSMRNSEDLYSRLFGDLYFERDGVTRVRGGDNRPLETYSGRAR